MYWAVTDIKPLAATTRASAIMSQEPDPMPPVAQVAKGQYSERVMKAIDHAIKISANDRPQSIAEWRDEMIGPAASPAMRSLSGRVAQMAGRRTLPTFDRSALRSGAAPYPPRPGAATAPAATENPPADNEAAAQPEPAPTVAPVAPVGNSAGDSQASPSIATPSMMRPRPGLIRPAATQGRPALGGTAPPQAATQSSERFVDNNDGTVIDRKYKLVGLKNVKCFGRKSWSDALSAVRDLAAGACDLRDGSHSGDWRLPTKDELSILVDWKESGMFPGVPPFDDFWSRDVNPEITANAWFVRIDSGSVEQGPKWTENRFWPVRTWRAPR
jgi:hypothetical protein